MTDRIKGLTVVFDKDYRDDDVESIINAIKMIKGVQNVKQHIANSDDWMNRERIRLELLDTVYKAFHPKKEATK